jgi:hypothetical protein
VSKNYWLYFSQPGTTNLYKLLRTCQGKNEVYYKMNLEDLKKLKRRATEDVQFNEDNAVEMSTRIPNLYQKYLSLYITELEKYKEFVATRDQLYGRLIRDEKINGDIEWKNKDEYNAVINCNDDYYSLRLRTNQQELVVKFLEDTLSNINRMSFSIKNYIDLKKFLGGLS